MTAKVRRLQQRHAASRCQTAHVVDKWTTNQGATRIATAVGADQPEEFSACRQSRRRNTGGDVVEVPRQQFARVGHCAAEQLLRLDMCHPDPTFIRDANVRLADEEY
jgi:sulfite reductase alpha subunit-like flavoprotein